MGSAHDETQAHVPLPAQSGVRRAGLVVLVGSGLGTGISLLVTPVISRIFDPAAYGRFALITGVVSIFVGVSTLRLEVLSLRVMDDSEATGLIRLGLIAASAWAAALTLVGGAAVVLWHVDEFWVWIGGLVLLASLQLLGSSALTRARRYRALATANMIQGASLGIVQVMMGLVAASVGSLLLGFGAARLAWVASLNRPVPRQLQLSTLWRRSRRFAAIAGGSAFVNSLTSALPILLIALLYGDASVGQVAIGIRVLVTPLGLVGQAAATANIGEIGSMLRHRDDAAPQLVKNGMRDLLLIGSIPCGLAGILGSWAIPLILGYEWSEAGLLLAVLAAGTLAQFVASPFSQLLNMTGNNRLLLMWDIGRFSITVLSLVIPWALGLSVVWSIGVWSAALVIVYCVLAKFTFDAVATHPQ